MKRNLLLTGLIALFAISGLTSSAQAVFNVQYLTGTIQHTEALSGFATYGDDMDGMLLTAYFDNGSFNNATWGDVSAGAGEAVGAGWSLYESGNTYGDNGIWSLNNYSGHKMTSLVIDAGAGNTVFDTTFGNQVGTVGSALGRDFHAVSDHANLNIMATYFDKVALDSSLYQPVGDIFRFLEINFHPLGLASNDELRFRADTDNITHAGDIEPVPEAGTLVLLSTGLIGAFVIARRRRA
jgi:PEP-CTERM motif